jgi:hypothetical protein
MQITINVPDQLAEQAQARGMALETYAEELLKGQAQQSGGTDQREAVAVAINRMMELRRGNRLGGVPVRQLIDEGRKY